MLSKRLCVSRLERPSFLAGGEAIVQEIKFVLSPFEVENNMMLFFRFGCLVSRLERPSFLAGGEAMVQDACQCY